MLRNIDNLGRLVIPSEYRQELGIENGSSLNIELEKDKIVITNANRVDYKARVEKAIEYIENNTYSSVSTMKTTLHLQNEELYDLLEILKGKGE